MTFFGKYELLKKSIPVPAMANDTQSVDCDFSDFMLASKNCYDCIGGYLEDCMYVDMGAFNTKMADCAFVYQSEKCYECVDSSKCHSCTYVMDCINSTDCHFSALLINCSDCFGCVDLTHKKYCIFNKQYIKEEYFIKVEELKKEKPEKILTKILELKQKLPHPANQQVSSENCPFGNYIYNSKNCYWSFNTLYSENSGYTFNTTGVRNCWDMFRCGGKPGSGPASERCYEMTHSLFNYDCAFLTLSEKCTNCFYGAWLINCSDCFGCIGLKNKKFCILNNQLTKEQYEKAVKEIKNELGWKH